MVSLDAPEKNREFAEGLGAKHVLLSDPSGETAKAYGVAGFGGLFAKRWTFYIDRDGVIRAIDKNVSTGTAGQDVARKLGELGFPRRAAN
jgi:peroxiredoxin Q/BCP